MEGSVTEGSATKGQSLVADQSKAKVSTKTINLGNKKLEDTFTVVKRNGMLVPFRRDRVFMAIEAAVRATKGISETESLPQDLYSIVSKVSNDVVAECRQQAQKGAALTVEGIQDTVEQMLVLNQQLDVARNYVVYREEHKILREDSPRNLKILRRDGKSVVRFNPMKIASAIEKAFRATLNITDVTPDEIIDSVNLLTNKVVARAMTMSKEGQQLHIELIQDEVERMMMQEGYYQVAKDFIVYRAERAVRRVFEEEQKNNQSAASEQTQLADRKDQGRVITTTAKDGSVVKVTEKLLRDRIEFACRGFEGLVSSENILNDSIGNFYEGIRQDEVDTSNILSARQKIEQEPAYSQVAARLLLDVNFREAFGVGAHEANAEEAQRKYFKEYIQRAAKIERLSPQLLEFNLEELASALRFERDLKFTYLGLQTLYDRYLIHDNEVRIETPQIFWMRVAMGLSLLEGKEKNKRAIEFYDVLSQFLFTSSTPTLFNSGTLHSQMSSCYLSTTMDDLSHIFKVVADDAQLSKWAGGLGNDWTNVRATGAWIKGTNGKSQGVIPFLKVANDTAVAVNQGGKRKGAMCAYLESWHLDIEDFLELRKNTGDERRRTHDMNTANWIPDLFMKRVSENGTWTLFSPSDVPDLHDLYGKAFEERYTHYEKQTQTGELKLFKKIEAVTLWRKMLSMLFETGHPWITFKDPSNLRSPQDHCGVVHSSNLCTEILLNTSKEETAVCNLGSVSLVEHVDPKTGQLKRDLLAKTVRTAVRMLDNVIDINFYPTAEAENSNIKHRPIGLGLMGFQDALYVKKISYASQAAIEFADESMELISYYAILASSELAKEKGTYQTYKGSKWDRGMLPIDTIELLAKERGGKDYLDVDRTVRLDWNVVREHIKNHGMRNSNTMAIAPTATISNITGVTQSIEPMYKHLFAKSNLSGEFIVHNTYLVDELKKLNIWDADMLDDLKYFDGSILEIERIPDDLKIVYLTAFEIEPEWIIECASRRQKWIDMGQSLNLYMAEPSGKKLHDMYTFAWKSGLKTTYYLRSLGATQIEKSTTDINRRGLQPRWMKNKSASSNISVTRADTKLEVPKVCGLDGDCESCQ